MVALFFLYRSMCNFISTTVVTSSKNKMKKIFTLFMAVALPICLTLSSCDINCTQGSGKQVSETRSVGDFTGVEVSGGYKVVLKQDSVSSIKISADDNVMQYIKTEVSNGKLKIHSSRSICSTGEYVINTVAEPMAKQVQICSENFPPSVSEVAGVGFHTLPASASRRSKHSDAKTS